ncbi:MAG TPA: hydantoinase/oxoprolinase family protein, partial [Polyangiaceae bacterium]|nr:hydantoinase/oxoprolinase family protein [Polyangiaceae bacterium]
MRHKIWIDRGGTFTDCIALDDATGELKVVKLLSGQNSIIEGIRALLGVPTGGPIPPCEVRMGTTIATNALLERKGCECLLITSRGFGDVPEIGNQARPDLFALAIDKPTPLYAAVVEVDIRCSKDGAVTGGFDASALERELARQRRRGLKSAGIVLLHAHTNGAPERSLGDLARQAGFEYVALSHEVVSEIGLLGRGDTTAVDCYLTPLLRDYLESVQSALAGSSVRVMQSSGGLTAAERLRGPNAILSGPAGGVVAYAAISRAAGYSEVIGFDMGGTSTDVSRFAGEYERRYENEIAGVRLRAPMLAIHTVAAGGGSICRYDGQKFSVGPDSAGADPGPLCYGAERASEPSVTDVNVVLGRLLPDRFPFPLEAERSEAALGSIAARLVENGHPASASSVAEGFFEIANLNMAEAIRQVSIGKGYDVRTHALFVFGGAGGQHACAIARMLGMRAVLFHRLSGVLSAYGMGLADVAAHSQAHTGAQVLDQDTLDAALESLGLLEADACRKLEDDGHDPATFTTTRLLDLRYRGTETALTLPASTLGDLEASFTARHTREFGYARPGHPIELCELRVEAVAKSPTVRLDLPELDGAAPKGPDPLRHSRLWSAGQWLERVPVFVREQLENGQRIEGPAVILESTGTIVVEPGFTLLARGDLLIATDEMPLTNAHPVGHAADRNEQPDPILLEVMNHQYMAIAEQMGGVLRRTAISTNIRERLDFS